MKKYLMLVVFLAALSLNVFADGDMEGGGRTQNPPPADPPPAAVSATNGTTTNNSSLTAQVTTYLLTFLKIG